MKMIHILLLVLFGFGQFCFAHQRIVNTELQFDNLSLKEGLSQSIVECIFQDSKGFMWFGTEEGLNKYDGYDFTVYRHEPRDSNSLSHSNILVIFEDSGGFMWIGTFHGGLTRFDADTGTFTRYTKHPGIPGSISSDVVRSIVETEPGVLWVGTDHGLNRLDTKTGTFSHFLYDPMNPEGLGSNFIYSVCKGEPGTLWLGTKGGGLEKFDIKTRTFTHYKFTGDKHTAPNDPNEPASNDILELYMDKTGTLWIGTENNGLDAFNIKENIFKHYKANRDNPQSLSNNTVRAIGEDKDGTLWVGTGNGLNRFNRETGRFKSFYHQPDAPGGIANNEIRSLYTDTSGILWIGTYGGGIDKLNSNRKKFVTYRSIPGTPNSLSHNIVWTIYEDNNGILWIGTHGGGLNRFDRKTGNFTVYRAGKSRGTLSSDMVRVVTEDHEGKLWIGTNGGGINIFDRETKRFSYYKNNPSRPDSLSHNEIRAIFRDRDNVMWVGTHGGGLNRFDRDTRTFWRFVPMGNEPGSLSNSVVRSIFQDREGTLWIGTYGGGMNKYNPGDETFSHYRADNAAPHSINNDYIFALHEDNRGNLWIATWGGGLNKLAPDRKTFTAYGKQDGLPSDNIYGLMEDRQGNLWLSTPNGLSRFNPEEKSARNYLETDGLQSNEFNGGAFFLSKSGEMFFGGINGLNAFFPSQIKDNPFIPPVVITSFRKMNKQVKLKKSITVTRELTLSYRDYFFSFEFAALDYSFPGDNRYAYKMDGLDEDWIETDSKKRFAVYTTLAPGEYVFRVKGTNNDGAWNNKGTSIKITITPPFWKTAWFQGGAVLLFLLAALVIYKSRMKNLLRQTRMKAELESAHNAQMSIMPQKEPEIDGFDISGLCVPASEVGGDFYEYLWLNRENSHFGITVGDVSGKAMKAAMTAVMANGIIFSKASETDSLPEIMGQLNQALYEKTDKKMFTALLMTSFNKKKKVLTYINSGLPKPLLKSGNTVTALESSGTRVPLGVIKKKFFKKDKVQLKQGDIVILFTDGISDAWDISHKFYGDENLKQFINKLDTEHLTAKQMVNEIMEDIRSYSTGMEQFDDITVVVVKIK